MSTPAEEEGYETYLGRVARGAGMSIFGLGLGRAMAYATQIALARMYGPTQLGFYVLGLTAAFITTELARFGLDLPVVRFVAQYQANNDVSRVRGTILLTLWVSFILSLALSITMFLGAGFLADRVFDKPAAEPVFRAFSISVPFFTVLGLAASATEGFQTVKYSIRAKEILQPLLNFVLIVFFYLLGAQVLGAVAAYIIAMAVASALALYYLKRLFPRLLDRNTPPVFERRAVFGLSGVGLLSYFTENVNVWAATIVLGIFASAEQVGIYNAAARTALIAGIVYQAFTYIFSPIISNHYNRGLLRDLENLYKDVSRWIFSGGVVVFFLTVLLSRDILVVFGEGFVEGWLVMDIIALSLLFALSVGATNRVLLMTGHQLVYILAFTAATVVGIVGSIVLVPHYGILGAALACAASYVIPNVVTVVGVRKVLNLWPYSRQYLKPLIAGLLAATVAFTVRELLPLSTGLPTMLVLAPIFLVGFTVMLLGLGLNPSDRQFFKAIWMAIRRAG